MRSVPFLGITTIVAYQHVVSVADAILPCYCSNSNSAFNLTLYAKGTARGVFTQKGIAFSTSAMQNCSQSITLTWPSNTDENSSIICCYLSIPPLLASIIVIRSWFVVNWVGILHG